MPGSSCKYWIVLVPVASWAGLMSEAANVRAADDKELRAGIIKLAEGIRQKDGKAVKRLAEELARRAETEDLMALFKARSKGGLGVGPKAGDLRPDGIEAMLLQLEKRVPAAKLLADHSADLERAAWITAAIAETTARKFSADKFRRGKDRRLWQERMTDLRSAAEELGKAFRARDPGEVRRAAIRVNRSCTECHDHFSGRDESTKGLIAALRNPTLPAPARANAAHLLADRFGRDANERATLKHALPGLVEVLRDDDAQLRDALGGLLRQCGLHGRTEFAAVNAALQDADVYVRYWFDLQLHERRKDKTPIVILAEALRHADTDIRCRAADALGRIGKEAEPATPSLQKALHDGDSQVRLGAIQALSRIGTETTIPALAEALTSRDAVMRGKAAVALGRIGKAAVPAVSKLLSDKDSAVRASAVYVLGRIGPAARDQMPALLALLKDHDESVRLVTAAAVKKIDLEAATRAGVR